VACRTVRAKRDLVRIVRTLEGPVIVDTTGKKSGRGAYLCRQQSCWDVGLRRGALDRALKHSITGEDRLALESFAATLPPRLEESPSAVTEHHLDDRRA